MIRVENSTVINRPVHEVFAYMTEPKNLPEWNSLLLEARAEGPVRQGTKIHTVAKFLGRKMESTSEVIEYETNKKFVAKTPSPFPITNTTLLEAEGGGTKVIAVFEGEPGGFFKLGEPIVARIAKKQRQAQFDTLKEILEAQVPAKA